MKHLSDNEFDKHFRDNLGDLSSTPSELNWIGIEGNLDAAMPAKKDRKGWIALSAVLLLLLGSGISYVALQGNGSDNTQESVVVNQIEQDKQARSLTQFSFVLDLKADQLANTKDTRAYTPHSQVDHASLANSNTARSSKANAGVDMPKLSGDEQFTSAIFDQLNALPPNQITSPSTESVHLQSFSDGGGLLNADHTIRTHKLTGLYIGMLGSLQRTSLSNPALDQWAERNDFGRDFTLGATYGLAVGYDFDAHFGVQAELQFNARSNQSYSILEGSNRQFESKKVQFRASYTRIPVLFKYRTLHMNSLLNRPASVQYLAGFSYGRLNWVNLPGWVEEVHPDDFNMQEWGVLGGIEYVMHLHQHYSLALGIRGGLYGHRSQAPVLIGATPTDAYAGNIGLTARLQFHLPRPEKN